MARAGENLHRNQHMKITSEMPEVIDRKQKNSSFSKKKLKNSRRINELIELSILGRYEPDLCVS